MAAAEAKEGILPMEEANTIKLALLLAKQRRWTEVLIQGTNTHLIKKLKNQDPNDSKCATIENVLDLSSLFNSGSL